MYGVLAWSTLYPKEEHVVRSTRGLTNFYIDHGEKVKTVHRIKNLVCEEDVHACLKGRHIGVTEIRFTEDAVNCLECAATLL